ncbi:hypothetical protein J1614_007086 [Plenodomus biglobosus]|nr:hypothetical protein J1614_007086 [Plenodomus biglobosus]
MTTFLALLITLPQRFRTLGTQLPHFLRAHCVEVGLWFPTPAESTTQSKTTRLLSNQHSNGPTVETMHFINRDGPFFNLGVSPYS